MAMSIYKNNEKLNYEPNYPDRYIMYANQVANETVTRNNTDLVKDANEFLENLGNNARENRKCLSKIK